MTEGNGRIETLKEATKIYQVGPSFPPWKTSRCLCCPMARQTPADARAEKLLERDDLGERSGHKPSQFSGL
jgi:hypothetical protein